MKTSTLFLTLFLGYCDVGFAQDQFTFDYLQAELEDVQSTIDMKPHFLGEEFSLKFQLLKESYTYREVEEISNKESTVIEKPSIYNSVKKLNSYLKKSLKKGLISEEEARKQLNAALDVALNIRYQETDAIEKLLWDMKKNPAQLAILFTERVKLEM